MVIAQLEAVQLGNTTQWIRIRGTDADNPLLLLIQQGPGLPMLNEVRRFEHLLGLEKDFTVVYWDQRGCGRSLRGHNGRGPITIDLNNHAYDVVVGGGAAGLSVAPSLGEGR